MFSQSISEIVLVVRDVGVAERFYREVVGLRPLSEPTDEWAWFWTGEPDRSAMLAVHRGKLLFEEHAPTPPAPPTPPARRWGPIHYAFRVPRDRLDDAVAHVRAAGVTVHGPVPLTWMRATSYYFYDPDGNLLEWWSPDDPA